MLILVRLSFKMKINFNQALKSFVNWLKNKDYRNASTLRRTIKKN